MVNIEVGETVFHNLRQGTEDWIEFKNTAFGASEAPIMLGVSPYKTRTDLIAEKKFGIFKTVSSEQHEAMRRGIEYEKMILPVCESLIGQSLYPAVASRRVVVGGEAFVLGASFDGITLDGQIVFEHKTLNKDLRTSDGIPDYYKPQLEQQLFVAGAQKVMFVASQGVEEGMRVWWYESDPDLRAKILYGWAQFVKDMEAADEKDFIHDGSDEAIGVVSGASLRDLLDASNLDLEVSVHVQIVKTNLDKYVSGISAYLDTLNTSPQTEEEFALAADDVKLIKEIEKACSLAKDRVINGSKDLHEIFSKLDGLLNRSKAARLLLEKALKCKKDEIKSSYVDSAASMVMSRIEEMRQVSGLAFWASKYTEQYVRGELMEAVKRKSTAKSTKNAVDTATASILSDAQHQLDLWKEKLGDYPGREAVISAIVEKFGVDHARANAWVAEAFLTRNGDE